MLCADRRQQFSLGGGTVPNLETLVIKHLQIKLYDAAVKVAVFPDFTLRVDVDAKKVDVNNLPFGWG